MLLLPCTFMLLNIVCKYARRDSRVEPVCLCSSMHMHELSYDKSTDFVCLHFFRLLLFLSLSLPPSRSTSRHPPCLSLPSTFSFSLSLFFIFSFSFLRLDARICPYRSVVCTRTNAHAEVATTLYSLFSSSSLGCGRIASFFVTIMV